MVEISKKSLKIKICDILGDKKYKNKIYNISEIRKRLGIGISVGKAEIMSALDELIFEGKVLEDGKGHYRIFSRDLGFAQGKLVLDEVGNGFVEVTDFDEKGKRKKIVYKIYVDDLNDGLIGDTVLIRPTEGTSKGYPLAKVERIIKRYTNTVFCNVVNVDGHLELRAEKPGFKHPISLNKQEMATLKEGQRLLVSFGELVDNSYYGGSIINPSVKKEDSASVIKDEKRRQEFQEAKLLEEAVTTIFIDEHMDGVVILDDGKVAKIDPRDLHDAVDGDSVEVQVYDIKKNGYYVASVNRIVERSKEPVICDVVKGKNGRIELSPCGLPFKNKIYLDLSTTDKALVAGDRISVILGDYDRKERAVRASYHSFVGKKNDKNLALRTIAIANGIDPDFSPEALAEAKTLPTEVTEEEKRERVDLTDELIFSIDDETCKDRDDAISIKRLPNGNYQVGIHISDVSHYIHPGMVLWEEAKKRSTSVYLSNIVIPMLPKLISNGICSLDEGKERLTLSTMVELTPDGDILNYKFVDSVIKSKKAMTYTAVNQILEEGIVPEGYEDYVESLQMWNDLSKALEKKKVDRGYVEFGSSEIKPKYDENGEVKEIHERVNGSGQKLIENAMLLNGMCYADFMGNVPSQFRTHDEPDEDVAQETASLLYRSGIKVVSSSDILNGKSIQKALKSIKDAELRRVVSDILLRSMKLARYSAEPGYHFGLGLFKYGQFTSPIRRFMDLLAHYMLKQKRDGKFNWKEYAKELKAIEEMCEYATHKERKADQAEREADQYDMSDYIDKHINEKFDARVTYVNSRGIYIKTREGIDGRIDTADVEGLKLLYDQATCSFRDKKRGIRIRIGDKLIATSLATDIRYQEINFGIVREDIPNIMSLKRKNK